MWVNFHTTLLSDVYNRAEIDFHNCQSVQMQMNYNAARLDISHIILKIVNNALLKCKILHIKLDYLIDDYIINNLYIQGRLKFVICIVICYFVIL